MLRNRGGLRYTPAYFEALLRLSQKQPLLRCLGALVDDEVASFLVVACNGTIAYYLHGGSDMRFQTFRPADLLFARAIAWAQDQGMQSFNMMASPAAQTSLVRYKEKWGGRTKDQYTYDVPIRAFAAVMFRLAARVYRTLTLGRG